ncbi:FMN-binding protein [Lentzea sp. NPDC042327]|uniref:FMN-binding protein n=1 Tax=Lentzea sp. NPDC042327 TaxID=3154801 RepID=UPI0033F26C4A
MKRAIPALVLSVAGLVPVWLYQPGAAHEGEINEAAAAPETPAQGQAPPTTTAPRSTAPQTGAPRTSAAAAPTTQPQQQDQVKTVSGPAVQTDEGTVQVQVTFQGTRITDVKAVRAPNSNPTRTALPILRQEALKAQSADIDTVSGATATSEGYKRSLQAALDSAR